MNLGENIRYCREKQALSREQLGKLINRSQYSVKKYELGEVTPSLSIVGEIANVLGVTPEYLMGIEHTEKYIKRAQINDFNEILNLYTNKITKHLKSIFDLSNYDEEEFASITSYTIGLYIENSLNHDFYNTLYTQCYDKVDLYEDLLSLSNISKEIQNMKIKEKVKGTIRNAFIDAIEVEHTVLKKETNSKEDKLLPNYADLSVPIINELSNDIYEIIEKNIMEDIIPDAIKNLVSDLNIIGQEKVFEYIKDLSDNIKYLNEQKSEMRKYPWKK